MRAHEQSVDLTGYVPGRAAAYRQAEIRPQVSGVLEKRLFVEGTDVKTGQQLYQIYPVPYEAALEHNPI
ncbi:biotin/lipoyl-binding protein [Komagataeibacter swingsii]|uniref:Biotin/lipoyl-binding protein n=2 Tax=Komagataeibacter swingsii TaxID=215220 RepID=A0A850P255_9PROT|nr:biotin/lipoyl-binding protein [Komagataeibacter swingsii]